MTALDRRMRHGVLTLATLSLFAFTSEIAFAFTDIGAGLTAVSFSSATWGDYDNDGDLDVLLAGSTDYPHPGEAAAIYENDSGSFRDIGAGLAPLGSASAAWGDYDSDGDLDILIAGYSYSSASRVAYVYRNDSGSFTDIGAALTGVSTGCVAWGDYDNDGDLDILLAGKTATGEASLIYRNEGGLFADIAAGLPGVSWASGAWGDYDNDGDLDVLLSGSTGDVPPPVGPLRVTESG